MDNFYDQFGLIGILAIVVSIIVTILVITAILKIPKIEKYQKATMKLTALMAEKSHVDKDIIQQIINEADKEKDYDVSKELSS